MLSFPVILAAAAESAAEASIVERFGIEWHYVIWQIVSFLIVMAVLYKFGIKPVIATMEERTRKISEGLKHAEEMQAKLDAAQHESAEIVRNASVEAGQIVDEARKSAKEYVERQTQEASTKANDILQKAQQAIELEHKKMLADARTEIARLVVTTTQQVLARELTDADRSRYNDAAVRELSET